MSRRSTRSAARKAEAVAEPPSTSRSLTSSKSIDLLRAAEPGPAFRPASPRVSRARRGERSSSPGRRTSSLGASASIGAAADQDHVRARPLEMDVGARILAGDPAAFARGQGDPAVDRHGELQRDEGPAEPQPGQEARHRARGRFGAERRSRPRSRPPAAARRRGRRCADRDRPARSRLAPAAPRPAGRRRPGRARCRGRRARGSRRRSRRAPPRPPRPSAIASACGRPPGWVQPRPTSSPSLTMTQPTLGLGAVRPRPRSPSAIAASIQPRVAQMPEPLQPVVELLELALALGLARLRGVRPGRPSAWP